MSDYKFFKCKQCGNLVGMIHNSGKPLSCCGEPMEALIANTVEAAKEKHIPVVESEKGMVSVKVGSAAHPMTREHHIEFIYLETSNGGYRKCLSEDEAAAVVFSTLDEKAIAVYAYCNLHGLWKTEITAD